MPLINDLLSEPTLVRTYYNSVSIALILSAWEELAKRGKKVCIVNFEKVPWQYITNKPKAELSCEEGAEILVYNAERAQEVPLKFRLVTSVKRVIEDARYGVVEKVEGNLFRLQLGGEIYLFRVVNERVVEEGIPKVGKSVVEVLEEYGGSLPMKDVVLIVSGKTRASREEVRQAIALLKNAGLVEVEDGVVSLNKYSGLKGQGHLL